MLEKDDIELEQKDIKGEIKMEKEIKGEIVKLQLRSAESLFRIPEQGEEIEQLLTISRNRVWITRKQFDSKHRITTNFKIDEDVKIAIFDKVIEAFKNYTPEYWFDVGDWGLRLINSENEEFNFYGPLIGTPVLSKLSKEIRHLLGHSELFLFDGRE